MARVKFDVEPAYVKPKLDDFVADTVDFPDIINIPSASIPVVSDAAVSSGSSSDPLGYKWFAFGFSLSLEDIKQLSDLVKTFMEKLAVISNGLIALLKLLRVLSSDLKSVTMLLKFLIKVIVKNLKQVVESFASTGLYMAVIYPPFDPGDSKYSIPVNGGYREFIAKVNALCLDSKDRFAPRFFSDKDQVGGFILAMIGGFEDPEFLEKLMDNFETIGRLFGFKGPTAAPAKDFKAVSGYYPNPKKNKELESGIKIMWSHPGTPVPGFLLFRGENPNGVAFVGKKPPSTYFNASRLYDKDAKSHMDGETYTGVELKALFGRPKYEFTDFNVEDGKTYYYQVISASVNQYKTKGYRYYIGCPTGTKIIKATSVKCIPVSILSKSYLDNMGNRRKPDENLPDWQTLSVKRLLGDEIDSVLMMIDGLSDKLTGMLISSSKAMDDYIKFFEKKIEFYLDIVNKIAEIIDFLMSLRLNGTFMCLNLSLEKGGMQGFVDRFNDASTSGDINQFPSRSQDNKAGGISQNLDRGIMAGIVLLYGMPDVSGDYFKEVVPFDKIKDVQDSFKKSQKALEVFTKILGLDK